MKPRTRKWTVTGRDSQDRVIQHGPFTSRESARTQAQTAADTHNTAFRVSTTAAFGSFTVEPAQPKGN